MTIQRFAGRVQSAREKWLLPAAASRLGRNSLHSTLGYVVPALATLLVTPLLFRRMGPANYGIWTLSLSFLGLIGVFNLGLSTAIAKFIAQYHAQKDINRLSATATMGFLIYLPIGFLLTVPALLLAPHVASLFDHGTIPRGVIVNALRLAALGLIPLLLVNYGVAVPTGLQRFKITMTIAVVQSLLTLGLALTVVYSGGSITLVVMSSIAVQWVMAIASVLIGFQMLHSIGARVMFSRSQARLMFKFISLTSISGLGILLFSAVDRVIVGALIGPSAVAYYAVAIAIAANLLILADVLTRPLMPAASTWSNSGQWGRVRQYLRRSTLAVGVLELTLGSILLVISRPLITIWLGADFATHALTPLRILIVVYAITSLNAPGYHIANGSGLPWIPALGAAIGGVLTIVFIFAFAGPFGLAGAAWANAGYWATLLIPALTAHALKRRDALNRLGAVESGPAESPV